ncbi:hypothetical protein [Nesterenkonia flava]|uniref:Uncharacterized protein n=1 Tax=Nesterenkonia flava TaxID=469799 RepID=A0ABU1FVH3_9MICC|nr:hypothetical protein [Nesterenkonia flava]MDR5712675.1 hypothetical protein [Nesterenkonia flava]
MLDEIQDRWTNDYAWTLEERRHLSANSRADAVESLTLHRSWREGAYASEALVDYEQDAKTQGHRIRIVLRGECVEHDDADRQTGQYPLDL